MFIDKETTKKALKLTLGREYFNPRRFAFQATFAPLFGAILSFDALGRALDDIVHPEYKDADISAPIFIMAAPRSGTTLLHRLMSLDEQFTYYTLWQTLFPTLVAYHAADALKRLDDLTGNILDTIQNRLAEHWFRGWEGIHQTRFDHAEEDEGTFFLQFATPSIWLIWPFVKELEHVAFIDQRNVRSKFAKVFKGTLKRHMWWAQRKNGKKTFLAKNVFLAGRLGIVTDVAPDARFVNIVRHPYHTIGSLMSFFTVPWRYHSPDIAIDGPQSRAFADIAMKYALTIHRFMQELPEERGITIFYEDLIDNPEREILKIYDRFGMTAGDAFRKDLHDAVTAHRSYESSHDYSLEDFGLSETLIYTSLKEIFDAYDLPRHPDADPPFQNDTTTSDDKKNAALA